MSLVSLIIKILISLILDIIIDNIIIFLTYMKTNMTNIAIIQLKRLTEMGRVYLRVVYYLFYHSIRIFNNKMKLK